MFLRQKHKESINMQTKTRNINFDFTDSYYTSWIHNKQDLCVRGLVSKYCANFVPSNPLGHKSLTRSFFQIFLKRLRELLIAENDICLNIPWRIAFAVIRQTSNEIVLKVCHVIYNQTIPGIVRKSPY
jgi:hypothetical protein